MTVRPPLFAASTAVRPLRPLFKGAISTISDNVNRGQEVIDGGIKTVSGNIRLKGTTVNGNVKSVSGNVDVTKGAQVSGRVKSVSGNVEVDNARVGGVETVSGDIDLTDARVEGDVTTNSGTINTENASISGLLTAKTEKLVLRGSTVGDIQLDLPEAGSRGVFISGNSIITGSFSNGNVFIGSGSGAISVSPGSMSNVNGYQVTASAKETRVVTPGGTIYVNGDKVYGNGPDTYAKYKEAKGSAPSIKGPGWKDQGTRPAAPAFEKDERLEALSLRLADDTFTDEEKKLLEELPAYLERKRKAEAEGAAPEEPKGPEQIVELANGSTVTGKIVFEGGNGKVIVGPHSRFSGEVEGGVVVRQ